MSEKKKLKSLKKLRKLKKEKATHQCCGLTVTGKACPNQIPKDESLCPVCKNQDEKWTPPIADASLREKMKVGRKKAKINAEPDLCIVEECGAEAEDDSEFCELHSPSNPENYPLIAIARCMAHLPTGQRCPNPPVKGGCCDRHQDVAEAIKDGTDVAAPVVIPPNYEFDENVRRLYDSIAVCHNISVFGGNNKDRVAAARAEGYLINVVAKHTQSEETSSDTENPFLDIKAVDQVEAGKIITYEELQELKTKKNKTA